MPRSDIFLKACRMERTERTPIWLINQYGRYLNDYREFRQKYDFVTMLKTPEIAAKVTLAPVNEFEVDAAILFSDAIPFLEAIGLQPIFDDSGMHLVNPIRSHADIESLVMPSMKVFDFTADTIRTVVRELNARVPLIGFVGAPFTLACHAIEGGNSALFHKVKSLIYSDIAWWRKLMEKLSTAIVDYTTMQVEAGVQVIQVSDPFVGILSPYDFRECVMPYLQKTFYKITERCPHVPIIYYGNDCAGILPSMVDLGCAVVSLDWKMNLPEAWDSLGKSVAIQGNLDPALLLGAEDEMRRQTAMVLDALRGRSGHIVNLGHSVPDATQPEMVRALVDFVHEYSADETE